MKAGAHGPTVLMSADAVGGVAQYALDLTTSLARAGVRVVLAFLGPSPSPALRAAVRDIHGARLHHAPYRLEWMQGARDDVLRSGEWLRGLERIYRPDVVHLNGYAHAACGFAAPTVVMAHSCVVSWWRAVHGTEPPAAYDSYREGVRRGLRAATRSVAPSRSMQACLVRDYGVDTDHVIYNGIDLERFVPRAKRPEILSAGRVWDEAKNLRLLAQLAPQLAWPVFIAGPTRGPEQRPSQEPELEPFARGTRQLGALDRDTLRKKLAEAAIYAAPAYYEPFGLAVLEAAASGAALVLSDIPTFRELWGGAALFAPPDLPEGFEVALARVAATPQLRKKLSRAARRRARDYSLARSALRWQGLYTELVTGKVSACVSCSSYTLSSPTGITETRTSFEAL